MSKPFSEACEQNKLPILEILQCEFAATRSVLEIGSGTGQHAVFFAAHLPHVQWHCTDMSANLPGIQLWLQEYPASNLHGPVELDVMQTCWPARQFDGIFSANTVHIMHWPMVEQMFGGISRCLTTAGKFCLYGPFNYQGNYSSDSNARFDQWLRQRDPLSGVRDMDDLQQLATRSGLTLRQDYPMPVNNRLLVWQKQ